jgi:SAM-dependent methyltransferase
LNNHTPEQDQQQQFLSQLKQSVDQSGFNRLILSKPHGAEEGLVRIVVRQVAIKEQPHLSFVYSYKMRDITKNFSITEGLAIITKLLGDEFRNANLFTLDEELQLSFSKKGKAMLHRSKSTQSTAPSHEHNREKQRYLDLDRPFLTELGVTTEQRQLIPAMSRKWKQINKFVELFQHAHESSPLANQKDIHVVDFGSGKGYLTFALHDYLRHTLKLNAEVTGVELRDELVQLCNNAISKLHIEGLHFYQGDVRSWKPATLDVMIALHACDTATDYAIHMGIRSNAAIIMCAPCCHKQIRPQMHNPAVLQPLLQYGVHQGQEAEMVTDTLRALLLEAHGYETQVFEFISLEHTSKNKMILAVKRDHPRNRDEVLAQVKSLKEFYGIKEQCLETLLQSM